MERLDENTSFRFGLLGSDDLWRGGAAVLGLSLWAQLFWNPVAAEFLSPRASLVFVGVYLLPTLVLFVSMFTEGMAGFLFFVPISFVPGLVTLPQQDVSALLEPHRALFAVGTLVSFVFAGALSSQSPVRSRGETREIDEDSRHVDGLYQYYFTVRFLIAAILFGVLVGVAVFDPSLTQAIGEHYSQGRVAAQIFLIVFGFFTWCVLAYTMFFLPAANLEYDVRRLSREIDGLVDDGRGLRWRLAVTVGLGLVVIGGLLGWQFGI